MFSKNLESRGVKVHWAKDAQEFNEIVLGILKDHNVKKMVKSKSMLTEECEMNPYLEHNRAACGCGGSPSWHAHAPVW